MAELQRYRARSWNVGEPSDEYPGRFYMAHDVDKEIKRLKARFAFAKRKWKALEQFYLQELASRG